MRPRTGRSCRSTWRRWRRTAARASRSPSGCARAKAPPPFSPRGSRRSRHWGSATSRATRAAPTSARWSRPSYRWCGCTTTEATTSTSTTARRTPSTRSIRPSWPRTPPPSRCSRTRWRRCPRRFRGRLHSRRATPRPHLDRPRTERAPPAPNCAISPPMRTLRSHVEGKWVDGKEPFATLVNPATEEPLARTSTAGIDFGAVLEYGRAQGGAALRELTFAQRGEILKSWSKALHAARDELLGLALQNGGNTRGDAKFDVDGAIATLAHYAELGAQLGSLRALRDGEAVQLGRTARYAGIHLWVPRDGVAVHVNAFNFPAWGTCEKAACALLAGMPMVSKPATSTALVAWRVAEIAAPLLPPGAFQFICGSPGELLERLGPQDVVAFTGSSQTAGKLREQLSRRGARLNVEADSLNAAVLGPDVQPGSATWDLFVQEVARDVTQKAGQKCTAVRRIFVSGDRLAAAQEALVDRLAQVRVGDPARAEVTMGPLSTSDQLRDVRAGIARLASEAQPIFGGDGSVKALAAEGKGYFVGPVLLLSRDPANARIMHQ